MYYKTEFLAEEFPRRIDLLMDGRSIEGTYTIQINGLPLKEDSWEPVFVNDQNNMQQDVTAYIRPGLNAIEIQVLAEHDACGVRDPIYLSGNFGVREDERCPAVIKMPEEAVYTDHYIKGFPYYSGTLHFEQVFCVADEMAGKMCLLEFDFGNSRYDCMEVNINQQNIGVRAFTPYQWEVPAGVLTAGENRLRLSVTNTLANMLDGTYFDYEKHELVRI